MSDEYAPTTEAVRHGFAWSAYHRRVSAPLLAEFDRWLAEHDREQREIGWDEGFLAGEEYLVGRTQGNFKYAETFKVNPYRKT